MTNIISINRNNMGINYHYVFFHSGHLQFDAEKIDKNYGFNTGKL